VLAALDEFKVTDLPDNQPLRLPIQDVYRFDDRRILAGALRLVRSRLATACSSVPASKPAGKKHRALECGVFKHAAAGESSHHTHRTNLR